MLFHTLVSYYYSIVERRGERKGSWDADTVLFLSHGTNEKYLFLFIYVRRGGAKVLLFYRTSVLPPFKAGPVA